MPYIVIFFVTLACAIAVTVIASIFGFHGITTDNPEQTEQIVNRMERSIAPAFLEIASIVKRDTDGYHEDDDDDDRSGETSDEITGPEIVPSAGSVGHSTKQFLHNLDEYG